MATRIYTKVSGSAGVTPSSWNFANQINPVTVPGTRTKNDGSAMTSKTEATGTTSPTNRAMGRTIIGPLSAQTISGTVKGQMRGSESNAGANATLGLAIKIVKPDGTDRAVLLAQTASDSATAPNELVTSLTNSKFENAAESASISLTSQSASDGDYLVIEWGFRSATTTSRNITLSYGNDNATDLPEDTSTTAANNPWWEFSATITFVAAGDLSAAAAASLSGTGISIFQGDISAAAAVSTSIAGGAIVGGDAGATASASASFGGGSVFAGDASASVIGTTDFAGQAIAQTTLTASAAASMDAAGQAILQAALSGAAAGSLDSAGQAIIQAAFSAAASGDAAMEARAVTQTDLAANSSASFSGDGQAIVQTVFLADAVGIASMISGGGEFVEGQFDGATVVFAGFVGEAGALVALYLPFDLRQPNMTSCVPLAPVASSKLDTPRAAANPLAPAAVCDPATPEATELLLTD